MNENRGNASPLEPGFETPQNGFRSLKVISVRLCTSNACHDMSHGLGLNDPRWTHGLENDIKLGGELLQFSTIVEGTNSRLESQFSKFLGLFSRTKVNSEIVVGYFGVLGKVREDRASDIT